MIDPNEVPIRLSRARYDQRLSNDGKPINLDTLYRWIKRGARARNGQRVKLETVQMPYGLATTAEAIGRFLRRLDDPISPPHTMKYPVGAAAAAYLDSLGI